MRWTAKLAAFVAGGILGVTGVACDAANAQDMGPAFGAACTAPLSKNGLLADAVDGTLVGVNPASLHTSVIATHVIANDGVAVRPQLDRAYVTTLGTDGQPGIWAIAFSGCRHNRSLIENDAELPSVSPDGSYLAFVTLNAKGRQTGTAIVRVGATGMPKGGIREYRATSIPPPLPITGVAVGANDSSLAVWGGIIDKYLGKRHPTVGTLDPSTTTSLSSLIPVFDAEGISSPLRNAQKPEDWQSAPAYLASGEFLLGDGDREISMPFTNTTPGTDGGGIRVIVHDTGPIESLATGPNGSIAWVGTDHRLAVATGAINLPFGPQAEMVPQPSPSSRTVPGRFTRVAWATTPAQAPPAVPVFHLVAHLPDVVGLSLAQATSTMAALALPVFVGHTEVNSAVPPGTVLAQDPPAGIGVACQCSVALTVSSRS
jgi:hypothetical protein